MVRKLDPTSVGIKVRKYERNIRHPPSMASAKYVQTSKRLIYIPQSAPTNVVGADCGIVILQNYNDKIIVVQKYMFTLRQNS